VSASVFGAIYLLLILTAFDIFIVWITAREYRRQRRRRMPGQPIEGNPATNPS